MAAGGSALAALVAGYATNVVSGGSRWPWAIAALATAAVVFVGCEAWLAVRGGGDTAPGSVSGFGDRAVAGTVSGSMVITGDGNTVTAPRADPPGSGGGDRGSDPGGRTR